jgi:hypothetical protein
MRVLKAALAGMFAVLTVAAHKLPPSPDAMTLYVSGQYTDAVKAGLRENKGASIATAARAALAIAAQRSPCPDCLDLAETLSRKAIAADASLADPHVFLAVTLGYKARIEGVIHAQLAGYAKEAKQHLDQALRLDPKNAWALAALGGWNIEIERKAGARLAHWVYGASAEAGRKDFAAAFAAAPDNLVLRYQYALSLAGLGGDEWRKAATDSLDRASTMAPRTAYEKFAQARAQELLAAIRKNDHDTVDKLLKRDQGYP